MNIRKTLRRAGLLLVLGLALAVQPAAARGGKASGAGVLRSVNTTERTVRVGDVVLRVSPRSILLDEAGRRISLSDLDERDDEAVGYTYLDASGHAIVDRLWLVGEDDEN